MFALLPACRRLLFFVCPLFIIYIHASIVMRCHSNRLLRRTLPLARTPGGENIFPLPWPRLSVRARTNAITSHLISSQCLLSHDTRGQNLKPLCICRSDHPSPLLVLLKYSYFSCPRRVKSRSPRASGSLKRGQHVLLTVKVVAY